MKDCTEVIDRYIKNQLKWESRKVDNAPLIYPAFRDKPVAGCIYGKGKG